MNEIHVSIGKHIHDMRKDLKYSIQDIANKIGVSRQTMAKIEHGCNVKLSFEMIYNLCEILECTADELIYGRHGNRCQFCQYK